MERNQGELLQPGRGNHNVKQRGSQWVWEIQDDLEGSVRKNVHILVISWT